ncbi:hypothetical protein KAFR_0J02680 [Kazachstania africana CBS 2517]|uniref:YbgI/family dinuclear metal center protein n=1 Tax=Kazachstania africana (strain ATCC 22294 / BCRC 22015 / CBS 2517 / CECT 1963 / NBRC 1671 / NRRL Y-8276) TaxID=1071382 RepID=H2B132_KAZAF|nr:hypothetical protein KAFR_0J02680 [Kazachstania africana CBS 2517]CCF60332.1 hypothetical protein KAFR_0J02680 [Kazachstania africana CBS 2517]
MIKAVSRTTLQSVVSKIVKHYPSQYADSSWDNTGLLIDCSEEDGEAHVKALLTIDLTKEVAQEAIDKQCNLIIAYHPFIFPNLKSIRPLENTQQNSLIKLVKNNVSVYCPHTAVDAAKGGVNDWLSLGLVSYQPDKIKSITSIERLSNPKLLVGTDTMEEVGYGRVVQFHTALSLSAIINSLKALMNLQHLQVSSNVRNLDTYMVSAAAVCAGSGAGVFKALSPTDLQAIDLIFTGELSHHDVLRYKEMGKAVIVCNHSNSERGYLKDEMLPRLANEGIDCTVSDTDMDPLRVI